jgi:hypothetical protein
LPKIGSEPTTCLSDKGKNKNWTGRLGTGKVSSRTQTAEIQKISSSHQDGYKSGSTAYILKTNQNIERQREIDNHSSRPPTHHPLPSLSFAHPFLLALARGG